MPVPGIRVLMRHTKRKAFLSFVLLACGAILLVLFNPDVFQRDVRIQQQLQPNKEDKDQFQPGDLPQDDAPNKLHVLELAKAELENKLLEEKLKGAKLARDLDEAMRQKDSNVEVNQQPQNSFQRKQYLRHGAIQQACASHKRVPGSIHTVMTSRVGVTYCHIPRTFYAFWLKVLRYVNRDFVEDAQSPFDIGTKSAIERPFIRTKVLRWTRIPQQQKAEILNTKLILAVENPFERLYNIYVASFVLPELWQSVGVKIEKKRRPKENESSRELKFKNYCGGDITFTEFLKYSLESEEVDYAPVYQLCDACQLNPTFVVKSETAREDSENVLTHFNLAWMVQEKDYANQTALRFIKTTINDNFDRLQRIRRLNCGTPVTLGTRLWKAFVMEGIVPDSSKFAPVESTTTKEELIQRVTEYYLRYSKPKVNVRALKVGQMVTAYNSVSKRIVEQIQRKYIMDFQLLGYSQKVEDIDKEAY